MAKFPGFRGYKERGTGTERDEEWQVLREGRYRTPDRRRQLMMREAIKRRIRECPVRLPKSEIEEMGVELGLDAGEAARLFVRLKGVVWRGKYVASGEGGWEAVLVEEIR